MVCYNETLLVVFSVAATVYAGWTDLLLLQQTLGRNCVSLLVWACRGLSMLERRLVKMSWVGGVIVDLCGLPEEVTQVDLIQAW